MTFREELFWFLAAFSLPAWLALRILVGKGSRAETAYGWLLAAQCTWILGQALELAVNGLGPKLWLDGLQYYPMCLAGALQVTFAHRFAASAPPRGLISTYLALSLGTATFYFLAPLHGLARRDAYIIDGVPFDALHYAFGAGDALLMLLCLFGGYYAVFIMVRHLRTVGRAQRESAAPILLGVALPIAVLTVTIGFDVRVLGQRDISFVVFGVSGVCVFWGVRNRRAVVTVPVAREMVFDRSPDAALVLDASGRILESNQAGDLLLGASGPHQVIGTLATSHPHAALSLDSLERVLDGDTQVISSHDGAKHFSVTHHLLRDLGAHLYLFRDVTDQERARQVLLAHRAKLEERVAVGTKQLQETERKFRAIFDQSFQLIGLLDPDGTLREANDAALRLIGAAPDDVIGMPFWDTPWWNHSAELRARLKEGCAQAARGQFVRFEATHAGADGEVRLVDFSLKPVKDADGRVSMIIPEGRDITDLRSTEMQLVQAQKMESLGRLAGGVAHDFNNLLTVITGNLELVERALTDQEAMEVLREAQDASRTAASLTQQLLAFGRKSPVAPRVLDVAEQLGQCTSMLKRIIGEGVSVSLDVAPDVGGILFDEAQLRQMLLNLAVNAKDAMPGGGTLTISAERVLHAFPEGTETKPWVRVDVRDTGAGMPDVVRARIFEPFFTTKEMGKGTGLGLAMVYGALRQHDGFVEVKSAPGEGSCFSLYFVPKEGSELESSSSVLVASSVDLGSLAYVVEDEPPVRRTVERMLKRVGFEVRSFENPRDLLKVAREIKRPDILLSDAMMPHMSGFELLDRIEEIWPQLPSIMMSGYSEGNNVRALKDRGVALLNKPFTAQDLLAVVDAVKRPSPGQRNAR